MRLIFFGVAIFFVSSIYAQVNLQNGSANYDIPIFSFNDGKSGLTTGVSLSYSSGNGLVVNGKAGNVGQNWNVVAGGVIVRKQNGEPDDQNSTTSFPAHSYTQSNDYNHFNSYSANSYTTYYYPNGFMYSEFPNIDFNVLGNDLAAPKELSAIPRFQVAGTKWKLSRRALADREQDVYIFNCNGLTGEFVIGKDGNPLLINDSKIVIEKTTSDMGLQGIRTRINEFTIKDAGGTIYKFGAFELSEVLKSQVVSNEGDEDFRKIITTGSNYDYQSFRQYVIQKWLLTEIVNPLTQEKILFEYEDYEVNYISEKIPSYQYSEDQEAQTVQVYENKVMAKLKRLKKIIFPDEHTVELFYTSSPARVDIPEDNPLSNIKILYKNEEINAYQFSYGYMVRKEIKNYSDPINTADVRFARLCLKTLQKTGPGIAEPAYKFNYYTGIESQDAKDIVPPFDCMAQDHWGFYNKASIVNNDDPNPTKETLKDLMFNSSVYRQPFNEAAKFGLLKSAENPFGGKILFEYEQNVSKDADNPSLTFTSGGVRVFKTTVSDGISSSNDIVTNYSYKLNDGTTSGWGYETPHYSISRQVFISNLGIQDGYTKDGYLATDITKSMTTVVLKALLHRVSFKLIAAIGYFSKPVLPFVSFIIGALIDKLFYLFNPYDLLWTNSYSFYPIQSQNPMGINYSRVEVSNTGITGGSGKTISEYTAPLNVRQEIPSFTFPYSSKQRFAGWLYGLPSKLKVYSESGALQKEIEYGYSFFSSQAVSDNSKSCKVEVVSPISITSGSHNLSNPFSTDRLQWEYYYPITGRAQLISQVEKNYGVTGTLSLSEKSFTHNNDYLPRSTTTTKSNGDVITTKTYYTNDYNNISSAIQEMKNKNMWAVPISTETWLTKPNGAEYLLDATINEFNLLPSGHIKIKKAYQLQTSQPLLKSIIGEQSAAVLVRNATYFKEQVTYNYDAVGNLTETITAEGKINSKIYDHNQRLLTAEITNALQQEVAYSSFETLFKGGWIYDDLLIQTGNSVTGNKYLHSTSFLFAAKKVVNSTKTYTLSFFNKGNGLHVTNSGNTLNPQKTSTLINGWTYYEYEINNPGTILISPSNGTDNPIVDLDELRLYPKDARMATVAYDPKVGKITDCDINNRLSYYYYDKLGRLEVVRDDKKNILKMYCYNYAGEPENCLSNYQAMWTSTGASRCKPCALNPAYYMNILQHEEKDNNPLSDTYNQTRWVDYTTHLACESNNWQATGNTICNVDGNGNNTGYLEVEQINANPCSAGYNSTNWVITYNPSACPTGGGGNDCGSCTGDDKKCINDVCETGVWSVVSGFRTRVNGVWVWTCTWKYCFSDGSQSTYSQVISGPDPCLITCF